MKYLLIVLLALSSVGYATDNNPVGFDGKKDGPALNVMDQGLEWTQISFAVTSHTATVMNITQTASLAGTGAIAVVISSRGADDAFLWGVGSLTYTATAIHYQAASQSAKMLWPVKVGEHFAIQGTDAAATINVSFGQLEP